MVKAIKVMLIPNNVQKTKMFQYAGASRFAYNWALAREIENYEKGGKFLSDAELRKEFPVTFPFAITKQSETNQLIFTKCLYLIEQYDQIQEETIYGTEHVLFSV